MVARFLAPTVRLAAILLIIITASSVRAAVSLEETGGFVTTTSQLAFKNATLDDVTADTLHGRFSGAWAGSAKGGTLTFNTFETTSANTKTCEAKLYHKDDSNNYIKGVLLTFTQIDDDVEVQMTGAKYINSTDVTATISSGTNAKGDDGNWKYAVCHLRLSRTPELYGGATVTWEAGEFATTKVGIDGNEYTITLPASGMSIDETTKNLVVASSGATTGATIALPSNITKASVLIKYSSLAAVSDKNVTLSTIKYPDEYVIGARTSANNALTLTGYYDAATDNSYPNNNATYGSGSVPTLPSGSGYFLFAHNPDGGTYSYAGYSPFTVAGGSNSQIRWGSKKIGQISIGGPISSQRVYAWPNVEIEGVALYVGSIKTDSDIADFEFTPTAEATISADGTYTLAGDNNLFDSIATDGEYVINVDEDATLNIPEATAVNMITFNVAANKTLTLTGSTLTAAGGIKVIGEGKVSTSVAAQLSGPIKGNGTICYDGALPTGVTWTKSAWTGTVWIKNTLGQQALSFNSLGNQYSTVKITNIAESYINVNGNTTATINPKVEIDGAGLKVTNGNGGAVAIFRILQGDGTLELAGGSQNGCGLVITDASLFTGVLKLSNTRYNVTFGSTGSSSNGSNGSIVIAANNTVTITSGKTWSSTSSFNVSGILAFAGTGKASGPVTTVNGSTLDLSGFTGTAPAISGALTLASGTTIKLPAGATLPYQIASSGDGLVDNVTVEIDGGATTTSAVKLANGTISLAKSATLSNSPEMKNFSYITWSSVTSGDYLLTISGTPTLLNFDDITGVDSLKIVVQNSGEFYVKGEMPANTTIEGLTNLTIADSATASFYAGYTRLYAQIGDTTTGNGAISSSGTTISVADPMNTPLNAGNYTIARWLTPQKLSTGYGYVNAVSATLNTASTPGLASELVYMADRIVLRVYDATAQAARGTIKLWAYGDSITEGYNMGSTKANYRVLLAQKLSLLGFNVEMVGCYGQINQADAIDPAGNTVRNEWKWHSAKHGGTAGPTSATGRNNLSENVDTLCAQAGNPDAVLLHIGVNDLAASGQTPASTFVSWTNVIWRLVNNLPDSKIIATTLLYGDVSNNTRANQAPNITTFNGLVRDFMASMPSEWEDHVIFLDMNTKVGTYADRAADDGITYNASGDYLHPDWWGHDQMAEGWLSVITNEFAATDTFNAAVGPAVASSELGAAAKTELADYRKGFKRYAVLEADKNILPTLETEIPYTDVNSDAASANLSKVAYFVEYVRADNNAHKWVWVDMDAFGTTIGDVGLPVANHQQIVRHLHVKSNHNGIEEVPADSEGVLGFVEFSPYGYAGDAASGTDYPTGNAAVYDWNDTLNTSGSYACMQVHRVAPSSGRGGQVLFAFNNWRTSSYEAEFGIGNFSSHYFRGANDPQTIDYTYTYGSEKMNAAAYSVKRIEIWTKPTSEYQSNDMHGTTRANNATFPNTTTWTITIPGSTGSVKLDSIVLGSRNDDGGEAITENIRIKVATAQGTVATSEVINGSGTPQLVATLADGGYKQTFDFGEDCVLDCGTAYTLQIVDASGNAVRMPCYLESTDTADDYSPVKNAVNAITWRIAQVVSASKVYAASVSADVDAFGSLSFSPSLPTDSADRANADLLVNVTDDVTLTIGNAMPEVGSIRFSIADGVTLTLADPENINAGEVVVYGPGALAFSDYATFKAGTDLEFAGAANVALANGQVLTTTGDIVVGSSATLTLAPATIAGLSTSIVSAASIVNNGTIEFTAPDESSDYSIVTTSTAVTLRRVTKTAFTYESYPNGGNPSGWFTAWNNTYSDNFSEISLRVGPSAKIPYVYHVSSSSHPYYDLTARSSVSFAVYADVSHMQSSKGIIACFGNSSNGLLMYRNGDWIVAARISGGSVDRSWVPGVAVTNGYHLYTVTYNSSNGQVAVYRDGDVSSASDGSAEYPHFASGALNAGFQFGTTYGGSNPTGFNKGEGLAVAAMRGYDVALQPEEVAVISESFPATNGKIDRNIIFNGDGKTLTVYSADEADGVSTFFGVEAGTVVIPADETVTVSNVRNANTGSNKTGTLTVNGKLEVTAVSTAPDVVEYGSNKGIVNGWWSGGGSSIINVTGELDAPNAYLEVIYQNNAASGTLNVNGGEVKVKGLYAHSNADNKGHVTISNGGVLELGEQVNSLHVIEKSFGYGTYRVKGTGTENGSIAFSGTEAQPTTLDPYGCTLTLNGMTGSGYVTVDDTSAGKNGKVEFVGTGSTFTGYVILTDTNAANIDLTSYTGTVLCQGTAAAVALLDGFAGTVYFTEDVDATGVDLSGATVHIADGKTFTANASEEGTLVLGDGATVTLNVDDNTVKYEGYVPMVSGSGVGYYNTDTKETVSGADHINGNNLLPYYNVWSASATASENTLYANQTARWKSDDGEHGELPADNKNVAFKLENGATVTLLVDATKTFNDIQVFGNGTLIIQQTGDNVMTVGKGLYTTANVSVQIDSGVAFAANTMLEVESVLPKYVGINCGTAGAPFAIPTITGSGMLYVTADHALESLAVSVGPLFVDGALTVDAASSAGAVTVARNGVLTLNGNFIATSLELNNTAIVNVGSGATLTIPTLSVSGGATLNMTTATSALAGTTSLSGAGTVNWNGKNPDLTVWKDCATWCGTNVISSLSDDGNRKIQNWGRYSNASSQSFIKLIDVRGWTDANVVINPEVILENGSAGYGLEISNGSTTDNPTYFAKLSGSGTFKQTGTGGNQRYVLRDVSDFTGSIEKTDTVRVLIIDATTTQTNLPAKSNQGHMFVANITAKIGDGNGWSVSSGKNLDIAGTAIVEMLGTASMTGPVTFHDGATLKFDNIGTSGAAKKLTLSSTLTFASGTVNIAFDSDAAEALYDGATLIDWTANGSAPAGMFAFADSSLSNDWVLFKEATGLKVYTAHIQDEAETHANAGTVSMESDGSLKANVTPTGAAVTLPERITKLEVSVSANGFGTLTAPCVAVENVVVKYGNIVTTGAYSITKSGYVISFDLNTANDASVTINNAVIKVKPEVVEGSPMTFSTTTPQFTVKTIPGLWYSVWSATSPDGFASATKPVTAIQATSTSMPINNGAAVSSGVKYYKIAVGATEADVK